MPFPHEAKLTLSETIASPIIRAMEIILKKHASAKLTIAGFGESRVSLEKLVKDLKLSDSVSFLGKVSDEVKVKLLGESWVFAQPSFMEGWGMSVIEANACGTPVVASNVTGLRDSVRNPETGYLVEYGNPKAFAEKLDLFLENEALRKRMGKNSINWAKNFSWDKVSHDWLEIITHYVS